MENVDFCHFHENYLNSAKSSIFPLKGPKMPIKYAYDYYYLVQRAREAALLLKVHKIHGVQWMFMKTTKFHKIPLNF